MKVRAVLTYKPHLFGVDLLESRWRQIAGVISAMIAAQEAELFERSESPRGQRWRPLSDNYLESSRRQALEKVGGAEARAIIKRRGDLLVAVARRPRPGFQKSARVRRTERSKILIDTGVLRASVVASGGPLAVRDIKGAQLEFGTRVAYAPAHQFGVREQNLPARPFLGLTDRTRARIIEMVQRVMRAEGRR